MGLDTTTKGWEEWSRDVWDASHWQDLEARDALKAAVEAATLNVADPAEKVKKATRILSGVSMGLGLLKGFLPI